MRCFVFYFCCFYGRSNGSNSTGLVDSTVSVSPEALPNFTQADVNISNALLNHALASLSGFNNSSSANTTTVYDGEVEADNRNDDDGVDRRPWTKDEDARVLDLVAKHGTKKWSMIGTCLDGRTGKQCRERFLYSLVSKFYIRWHNHLNPDIKKDIWSAEEDLLIIDSHRKFGSRWSEIAKSLPGRTDNSIKNRWYSMMRRVGRQQSSSYSKVRPTLGGSFLDGAHDENDESNNKLFRYCLSLVEGQSGNAENSGNGENSTLAVPVIKPLSIKYGICL